MSDASARHHRRRWLAIAGAVSTVLIVSLGVISFWPGGAAQDGPNDPSDAGDASASAPLGSAASGSTDVPDAWSDDAFDCKPWEMIAGNRDERTILFFRNESFQEPYYHAYIAAHLDGRAERQLVLTSRGYPRGTADPSALHTPESRAILARLEGLAKRFHRVGAWLPYLAFGAKDGESATTWYVRFDEDGGAEIETGHKDWSWVRMPGSPDFVPRPRDLQDPRRVVERLPVVSYKYDDHRTAHLSEGTGDVCFFWEAPPAARRKLTCSNGIHTPSVLCDRGICGLFTKSSGLLEFSLVDQRSAQILADGYVDGIALDAHLGLAVNDTGLAAISYTYSKGRTTVVDTRTGIVRRGRDHRSSVSAASVWLDDHTLIVCEDDGRGRYRIAPLSLDDEGAWEVRKPDRWRQADVGGGSR
ncbi:hypothetical protein KEG38_14805 [Polyangium jinanense]|uniref:hypothetical protein n=1 Tax=Polyangium jinanense TaxID=2829994 RepID=UPI002341E2F5|nr:hypothetical protein [Polyangium jinanense]MDC3955133.1 hypothetical protein [Polyangium jinanense]